MSKQDIINLINESNIELAIKALLKANPNDNATIMQSARWNGLQKDIDSGTLTSEFIQMTKNQVRNALIHLAKNLPDDLVLDGIEMPGKKETGKDKPTSNQSKIFISYNHADQPVALKVKQFFEKNGFPVLLDVEEMNAGEDIKDFIERCIRDSQITLSLVSTKSLLSGWVGMESVLTLTGEGIAGKQFIACALENDFFDLAFMRKAVTQINENIKKIDEEIQWRIENGVGIEDVQSEKSRNNDLKSKLPTIIATLKERLTVDISGDNFESGLKKVLETIS